MLLLLKNSNNLCVECEDGDEAVSKVMEIMKEKEIYERRKKSQKENQERERDTQIDLERRSLSSTTDDAPKIVACSDTTSVSVTASSCDDKVYDYVADLENSVRRGAGQGRGQADGQGGGLVKSSLDELIKTKSNRVIEMDGDTVRLRWRKGESSIANNDSIEPRYSDLESGVSKDHGPDPKKILDVEVQRKGTGTGTRTDLCPSRSNPGSWRRGDSILPFKSYTAILMVRIVERENQFLRTKLITVYKY